MSSGMGNSIGSSSRNSSGSARLQYQRRSRLVQSRFNSRLQLVSRLVAANGYLLMLDMPPQRLDQVQLRAVRWQVEQFDACCLQSTYLLPDLSTMMRRVVVQHHHASLLPNKALQHHSQRCGHAPNLCPDELQHVSSLERGGAGGIRQSRLISEGSKSANDIASPALRSFIRHDGSHSYSGPGVTHGQSGSKACLVQVVQLDKVGDSFLLQRFKASKPAAASAWSCGSFCLCLSERKVRFQRNLRLLSCSLRYLGWTTTPNCSHNHSARLRQVQVRPSSADWSSSCSSERMYSSVSTGGRPGMGASAKALKSPSCETKRLRYLRTVASCVS